MTSPNKRSRLTKDGTKIIHYSVYRGGMGGHTKGQEAVVNDPKPARNAPCPCGSLAKFKRCCGKPE